MRPARQVRNLAAAPAGAGVPPRPPIPAPLRPYVFAPLPAFRPPALLTQQLLAARFAACARCGGGGAIGGGLVLAESGAGRRWDALFGSVSRVCATGSAVHCSKPAGPAAGWVLPPAAGLGGPDDLPPLLLSGLDLGGGLGWCALLLHPVPILPRSDPSPEDDASGAAAVCGLQRLWDGLLPLPVARHGSGIRHVWLPARGGHPLRTRRKSVCGGGHGHNRHVCGEPAQVGDHGDPAWSATTLQHLGQCPAAI